MALRPGPLQPEEAHAPQIGENARPVLVLLLVTKHSIGLRSDSGKTTGKIQSEGHGNNFLRLFVSQYSFKWAFRTKRFCVVVVS